MVHVAVVYSVLFNAICVRLLCGRAHYARDLAPAAIGELTTWALSAHCQASLLDTILPAARGPTCAYFPGRRPRWGSSAAPPNAASEHVRPAARMCCLRTLHRARRAGCLRFLRFNGAVADSAFAAVTHPLRAARARHLVAASPRQWRCCSARCSPCRAWSQLLAKVRHARCKGLPSVSGVRIAQARANADASAPRRASEHVHSATRMRCRRTSHRACRAGCQRFSDSAHGARSPPAGEPSLPPANAGGRMRPSSTYIPRRRRAAGIPRIALAALTASASSRSSLTSRRCLRLHTCGGPAASGEAAADPPRRHLVAAPPRQWRRCPARWSSPCSRPGLHAGCP